MRKNMASSVVSKLSTPEVQTATFGVVGYSWTDLPFNELAGLAGFILILIQIVYWLIKMYRNFTGKGQW